MIPEKIDRYQIKGILGEGGMAIVFHGHDPRFEREVALKMLLDHSLQDEDTRARFLREGKIVARLDHPHIVPVYDIGEEDNKPYLVMRYMSGGSLRDWIKRGPLTLAQATKVLEQVSGALDEAHKKGIIHRDIKPGNIMLDQRGDIFLSDFGIVKNLQAQNKLTVSGAVLGTAAYMSPEQCAGKVIDGRSDIYALGIVLFEMLTGELPFNSDSFLALVQAHILDPIPYLSDRRTDLPAMCQIIIDKALAKNPDDRYTTANEMYQDLQTALLNSSERAKGDDLFYPPIFDTAKTRYEQASPIKDTKHRPLTTSEKIKVQLKGMPVWAKAGIVGITLLLLFSILYQAMAAPNNPEPTPTLAITETSVKPTETLPSPSETPVLTISAVGPTAVINSIIVRDWDNSAIWQVDNEVVRIPDDGKIPLTDENIVIQSNAEPMELLFPDRTRLVLDSNTTISLHNAETEQETAVSLEKGRVGVEPVGFPVSISAPTGVVARINSGLMGVTFDPELETFDIDCLDGVCELNTPEGETVFLSGGEKRTTRQDNILESEDAQFEDFLLLFNRLPTTTPVATATATIISTPTPTATWTPLPAKEDEEPFEFTIGESVTGKQLDMIQFGDGDRKFIIVGGIHGGYAPNTIKLADELIAYYTDNPTAVPDDVSLFIISNLNPDAKSAPAELAGRLNANNVDLNRNWDCRWVKNPIVLGNIESGAGGTAPESEPEVNAMANFLRQQNPTAVIQFAAHGRGYGTASPGACIDKANVSVSLSKLYGNEAGYRFPDSDNDGLVEPDSDLNGDMTNWLDSINTPAISILLSRYENTDFENNLAGLTAVLETFTGPETPAPTASSANSTGSSSARTDDSCPETAVINQSVYQTHQDNLGCATSSVKNPAGATQQYENGTMVWRGDSDNVYLLYDNGSLANYIVTGNVDYEETTMLKGAFGYVWNTKAGVKNKIGDPLSTEEVASPFKVQDFENGSILNLNGASSYQVIFPNSNRWEKSSS